MITFAPVINKYDSIMSERDKQIEKEKCLVQDGYSFTVSSSLPSVLLLPLAKLAKRSQLVTSVTWNWKSFFTVR